MAPVVAALLPGIIDIAAKFFQSKFPDPVEAQKMQSELTLTLLQNSAELEKVAGEIIKTEAASEHWLAANWRPLLMLTFGALIVARWFGWAAPNLSESEYIKLWDIVELGIGGYVIGRSAEKVLPSLATVMKRN